jgi:serine/threonine-protein kinase
LSRYDFSSVAQSVKPADVGVTIGQVFQGKYRVESILGHGGMGVVAECIHLALNERVAIKMLRQDVLGDQDAVSRFIREAQAAVKLKSEYVARVSDVGTADNGTPYMVMEYLEGHDLGELLKQRGVLPVQWAVELMLQTAEALCEAHSLGIVHRDIKPTNLFVTWRPDGTALIKVLDFGISKSPMGTDLHLTQTQSLLGTPAYMSPEQMRSARLVDHRTDIWSLGTVFYESLEGHRPFEADSFSEMCVKVAVDPPTQMQNTPPALQQIILRCLAKAHEQRYANMAEFARDLVPFAADPHNAQMLVERMLRMLKRSTFDWEGNSTGTGRQALPASVKDVQSGAVRSTPMPGQWNIGTDPSGRAWHGHTPPPRVDSSAPFSRNDSQPFGRPYTEGPDAQHGGATLNEPRSQGSRSRVGIVVVALGLITAGAIAFGVVKATETSSTGTSQGVQTTTEESSTTVMNPGITETGSATLPTKAVGDNVVTPTETGSAAAGSASVPGETGKPPIVVTPGETSGSAAKTDGKTGGRDTNTKKTGGGKSGQNTKSGGTTKTSGGTTTKRDEGRVLKASGGGSATLPPVEEKKVEPPKVPCDPFGAMHGCQK